MSHLWEVSNAKLWVTSGLTDPLGSSAHVAGVRCWDCGDSQSKDRRVAGHSLILLSIAWTVVHFKLYKSATFLANFKVEHQKKGVFPPYEFRMTATCSLDTNQRS